LADRLSTEGLFFLLVGIGREGDGQVGAFGTKVEQDLVGAFGRHRRIEAAVVQFVAPKRRGKGHQPVADQFIGVGVLRKLHLIDVGQLPGEQREAEGQRGAGRALAPAGDGTLAGGQKPAARPGERHGEQGDTGNQRADRVGLADIADHLVGVDQIVDGNEIEAGGKLLPEGCLGQGAKEQRKAGQKKQDQAQPALPASRLPAARPDGQQQPGGRQQPGEHRQIEADAAQEYFRPQRWRHGIDPAAQGQSQPGQEGDAQEQEKIRQ
jgi:hypothetical protein